MQKVTVMIHNLLHGDGEVIDADKIEVAMDRSNHTEIIYSVIVGGKPVLASTAAEDMRLLKLEEVVKIMENDIVLKAERKLKTSSSSVPNFILFSFQLISRNRKRLRSFRRT